MSEDGFMVKGEFFPAVEGFRALDGPLVVEVTGMKYMEFLAAYQEMVEAIEDAIDAGRTPGIEEANPIVVLGLLAVAIWQKHPEWTRAKVTKFLQHLKMEDWELVGGDVDEDVEVTVETDPPSAGEEPSSASATSSTTPSESNGGRDVRSEVLSRTGFGLPPLVTSSPE